MTKIASKWQGLNISREKHYERNPLPGREETKNYLESIKKVAIITNLEKNKEEFQNSRNKNAIKTFISKIEHWSG